MTTEEAVITELAMRGVTEVAASSLPGLIEQLRSVLPEGEVAFFNQCPLLGGLEGKVVRVRDDQRADDRLIVVGLSDGWAPHHLEINGGAEVRVDPNHNYYTVEEL